MFFFRIFFFYFAFSYNLETIDFARTEPNRTKICIVYSGIFYHIHHGLIGREIRSFQPFHCSICDLDFIPLLFSFFFRLMNGTVLGSITEHVYTFKTAFDDLMLHSFLFCASPQIFLLLLFLTFFFICSLLAGRERRHKCNIEYYYVAYLFAN